MLVCRYLLRDVMVSMVRAKWKKWDILDAAIEKEGWKLLLLLRLSPMVPYNLLNIAMATTKMHFWVFAIVSAIGKLSNAGSPLFVTKLQNRSCLMASAVKACRISVVHESVCMNAYRACSIAGSSLLPLHRLHVN